MNKTNKILVWAVLFLSVLNVATIGTIIYHTRQEKSDSIAIVLDESKSPLTGRYFRQTLGFDNNQMEVFREANHDFQPQANMLIFEMDSLKNEMYKELNNTQPDSLKLNNLSNHIGMHHAELKRITNSFYLKIKSVCNEAQREQLEEMFLPLYKDERNNFRQMRRGNFQNNNGHRNYGGRGWNRVSE